jgi:hypothetical protein
VKVFGSLLGKKKEQKRKPRKRSTANGIGGEVSVRDGKDRHIEKSRLWHV